MAEPLPWVDAADLLAATGARNISRSGNELTFSCMSGNHAHGDSTPSAGMNATTTLWRCRSPACGLRGNAVDYLMARNGYTESESMRVLSERYGGPEQSVEAGALEAEVERIRAARNQPEDVRTALTEDEYLDRFGIHWPQSSPDDLPEPMAYMIGRGFSPQALNDWQIGYDLMSERITIPVFNEDGVLVGIKGRAWKPHAMPKYISIGDAIGRHPRYGFNTYQKSLVVFGLYRFRTGSSVVLCEGELNVVALAQIGFPAVAVAGSEFSERQAELIISRFSEVTIYFDWDAAGRAGMRKVVDALAPYMPVRVVQFATGDAADALDAETDITPFYVRSLIASAIPSLTAACAPTKLSTSMPHEASATQTQGD